MNSEQLLPVLTKEEFMELRTEQYQAIAMMEKLWIKNDPELSLADFVSIASLAYAARVGAINDEKALSDIAEKSSYDDLVKSKFTHVIERYPGDIFRLAAKRNEKQLLSLIAQDLSWFFRSMGKKNASISTPYAFSYLARELLDIHPEEIVMDFSAGIGEFSIETFLHTETQVILGTEISEDAFIVSTLRFSLLRKDAICINLGNSVMSKYTADKVFADNLELVIETDISDWKPHAQSLASCYRELPQTRCNDWTMVLSALEKQIPGGRTVLLTYDGFLIRQSKSESELRRQLVESGRLEAVISLPIGIMPDVNAQCDMLVFSHGNKTVKMVDARDCRHKSRYASVMNSEDLEETLNRYRGETDFSRTVTFNEIEAGKYELLPSAYLLSEDMDDKSQSLDELIHFLKRGQMIPADYLNKYKTNEDTGFQYLMLKDLEDETLYLPLTYIDQEAMEREEQKKAKAKTEAGLGKMSFNWDNYCIEEDYLVISRSMPIKMAIVPNLGKEKVLANVNLYFMKVDERLINPVYMLCYLKSPVGSRKLENLYKGSGLKTISRKDLLQFKIPVIPMEKQKEIADKYLKIRTELMEIRKQKAALVEKMEDMIEAAFKKS